MRKEGRVFGPWRAALAAVLVLAAVGVPAFAQSRQLVVVTSFPKELFETYKQAFEARYPGVEVVITQKQTSAGVTYVRETAARPVADIFWASAVDAFMYLKQLGLLQPYRPPAAIMQRIASQIGSFPVHDPDGYYLGFAVSGYGIMWNKPYLQAHRLPEPREWDDLVRPEYYGHVVISSPSRSGTTHLTIEAILQAYGWEKGWELLLAMGGNMGTITERSFGVPEAVTSGQYGIGVVIDFFGLSAIATGQPVGFAYPVKTAMVPANVAILKGAPNADNARRFVDFLLSEEGQRLLFKPEIGRLPVDAGLYAQAPPGFPNPFAMKEIGIDFNADLSSNRYQLINILYDQIITFRHGELKAAWGAIHRAQAALAASRGDQAQQARPLLEEARRLASGVPVPEAQANDPDFNRRIEQDASFRAALEREWDQFARDRYNRAAAAAREAERLARR